MVSDTATASAAGKEVMSNRITDSDKVTHIVSRNIDQLKRGGTSDDHTSACRI
jgi:hypothetical protein